MLDVVDDFFIHCQSFSLAKLDIIFESSVFYAKKEGKTMMAFPSLSLCFDNYAILSPLCCKLLGNLSALGEMLIEGDDGFDAFVEVVEAVVLVG